MTSKRVKTKAGVDEEQKRKNRTKARVRAKVEWPFRVLKRVFGFVKVRYRGLKKNHEWLCAAFAAINVHQHRRGWPGSTNGWSLSVRSAPTGVRVRTPAENTTTREAEKRRFAPMPQNPGLGPS
jgi:Transposase DDE domain